MFQLQEMEELEAKVHAAKELVVFTMLCQQVNSNKNLNLKPL
jgi:hypothetical protein